MTSALTEFQTARVHHVNVDGLPIAYRRIGQGPPLLMIHGWPLSGVTYRAMIQQLRHQFTCYVPDLPGAGDTPWDPRTREVFSDFTQLLEGFVDALSLSPYALVGHDSGGAMARNLAARHPQRVRALLLTNTETPGHVSMLIRAMQAAARVPGSAVLFRAMLDWGAFRRSRYGFGSCFGNRDLIDSEFRQTLAQDVTGAIQVMRRFDLSAAHGLEALHAKITAPTVLVWGEDDPFFSVDRARAMAPQFAGPTELHVVPRTRLLVHEEAPERVVSHAMPVLRAAFDLGVQAVA